MRRLNAISYKGLLGRRDCPFDPSQENEPYDHRQVVSGGWHLHFVTADRTGGGHLLDCQGGVLRAQMQDLADVRLAMPETAAFLQADLSQDPSRDLDVAERGGRPTRQP